MARPIVSKKGTVAAIVADGRDISDALIKLDLSEPAEQAAFWRSCVDTKQDELDALGGLPIDAIYNDVLTRYFDSSASGLQRVFKSCLRDQKDPSMEGLDKGGLYDGLSEHYNFFKPLTTQEDQEEKKSVLEKGENEKFERICDIVGLPVSAEAFGYAVRRLRIALLMHHFNMSHVGDHRDGKIFHIDYDDDNIFTPFHGTHKTRKVTHQAKTYSIPVVSEQTALINFAEYLFTSKLTRKGSVHWTHLHHPSTEIILAVGQVWRLTGPDLALMSDLRKAQPQVSLHSSAADADKRGYSWSSVILPGIYLDRTSKQSLELFKEWFHKRQDPARRKEVSPNPPRIRVAVTHATLCMMWTSESANTAITVSSALYYIGKWITDADEHKTGPFSKLLDMVTCAGCCARRQTKNEAEPDSGRRLPEETQTSTPRQFRSHGATGSYCSEEEAQDTEKQPLLGQKRKNEESGVSISDELNDAFENGDELDAMMGEKALDEKESCLTFERTFEKVLAGLERQNSMLRMGNHYQLLMRIVSNRSSDYLEVLELYEAAIARLSFLLREDATSNKDDLIKRIEVVRLELNTLDNIIAPFGEYVVPQLASLGDSFSEDYPLCYHHIKDIQNNIRQYMPKSKHLMNSCSNLSDEYDRNASDKMNNILNILTFITFVITPLQLMTGIYGMNFKIMPELHWDRGYSHYFWGLAMTLTVTFAFMLVCLKRG